MKTVITGFNHAGRDTYPLYLNMSKSELDDLGFVYVLRHHKGKVMPSAQCLSDFLVLETLEISHDSGVVREKCLDICRLLLCWFLHRYLPEKSKICFLSLLFVEAIHTHLICECGCERWIRKLVFS